MFRLTSLTAMPYLAAFDFRPALHSIAGVMALAASLAAPLAAAERFDLREPPTDARVFRVAARLDVAGQLQTDAGAGKAVALKLSVAGRFTYLERRLAGGGRDAEALRNVRFYEQTQADIREGDLNSALRLAPARRLIVAHGKREGLEMFCPAGPLTAEELELLQIPGDSLAALALLPPDLVELGDSWKPADWVLQLLTGLEAVEKAALTCKLATIEDGLARVEFKGEISGATLGAAAALNVEGWCLFDLTRKFMTHIELTQTEKRSVGVVSPGLDVTARVAVDRTLVERPDRLTDGELEKLALDANAANLLLLFESSDWKVRFYHDRQWRLFHRTPQVAILRLMDKGALVAQCNVTPLQTAAPGSHVSEQQFQTDVQKTLGKNFQRLLQTEKIDSRDARFIFRVVAAGETAQGPTVWVYYLIAAPDGRQMVAVFVVEPKLLEQLQAHDLSLVSGMEFLPAAKPGPTLQPTPAPN